MGSPKGSGTMGGSAWLEEAEGWPAEAASRWDAVRAELTGAEGAEANLAALIVDRHCAAGRGGRTALRWLGRRFERRELTYDDLSDLSGRYARVLAEAGLEPGETVAILLRRVPDLYAALLGVLKAGGVCAPLFAAYGPGPIRARLALSRARVLITTDELYARKVAPSRALLPDLGHVLVLPDQGGAVRATEGGEDLAALVAAAEPLPAVPRRPVDPALLHFTSGTTGQPKGVVHPHRCVLAQYATAKSVFGLTPDDVFWCTADPGWITGTAYGLIAPLACGATVLVDEGDVDPRRWYGILADEKVTAWYTTPTAIRAMMRYGAALARSYRDTSLRVAASVGEPLNAEAVVWGLKALGVPFLDTWWQTEIGSVAIANAADESRRPGSMGQPLPGIQAAVVRRAGGRIEEITAADTVGELAIRPGWPSMLSGYLGEGVLLGVGLHDGWYLTGDLVRRDADGYYWFVGRADDMIKCGALEIGPFEVEGTLLDHPALAEVGVVGKPDLLLREVPVAFASLNPGFSAGSALEAEILSFARQQLGPALAPREIHFVAELPKTLAGKIMRRVLRARAVEAPDESDPIVDLLPPTFAGE